MNKCMLTLLACIACTAAISDETILRVGLVQQQCSMDFLALKNNAALLKNNLSDSMGSGDFWGKWTGMDNSSCPFLSINKLLPLRSSSHTLTDITFIIMNANMQLQNGWKRRVSFIFLPVKSIGWHLPLTIRIYCKRGKSDRTKWTGHTVHLPLSILVHNVSIFSWGGWRWCWKRNARVARRPFGRLGGVWCRRLCIRWGFWRGEFVYRK